MDTQRNEEFVEEIKKRLSEYRFYHSLNVADEAKRLAKKYGADEDKAFTAGLIHDIMKDTDYETQRELIEKYSHKMTPTELANPKIWHAMSGEVFLRHELNVKDEDILSAVRYHTTARDNMSLLEKVLYIADYTSAERNYPDVDVIREKAERSLEEAMLYGLQFTIKENVEAGAVVHPDSILAYNEVAISDISWENSIVLTFIPIPRIILFILSISADSSVRIPATFLLFIIISFGHFIFACTPKSFKTLAILAPAIKVIKGAF